jgi:rifampicin phosphotransferase
MSAKYFIYCGEASLLQPEVVGAKAWNLARLRELGVALPHWFVITTRVFDELVAGRRESIERILASANSANQAQLDEASQRISGLISRIEISNLLSQSWLAAIQRRFGSHTLVSVRSSVVGEDSQDHSFAGQMESFLNVPFEGLVDAIKKVWASAFSARALAYRRKKELSLTNVSTAVIVQEMVQSVQSGVLFTTEPETGAQHCVISAGFGLGEGVVTDRVETDTYRVGWHSNDIVKQTQVKQSHMVLDAARGYGSRVEAVPAAMEQQAVLIDDQILRLRDVGLKVARHFGQPQDIEWAFDGQGKLFLLQARPITHVARKIASPAVRIWDNSNVVESYPGLTLPLTFSFARSGYETSFRPFARKLALGFFPFQNPIQKRLHIFKNMIGLLDGRIYYNLFHWYEMLSFLPGFENRKRSWDQMIGIERKTDFPRHELPSINKFCAQVFLAWKLLNVKRTATKFFAHFDAVYRRFNNLDFATASEHQLIEIYETLAHQLSAKWALTLDNDICAMTYYDWLKRLCAKLTPAAAPNIHNDLLCGEQGIESVAPVHSLARLAEMVRGNATCDRLFRAGNERTTWEQIQTDERFRELKIACERHVREFGDRGFEELKLDHPTLREQPELLVRLVRNHLEAESSVEALQLREREIRSNAKYEARLRLKNPIKRLVFWFVLNNARRAIANRENMRFARSRLFGIARRIFRRMGDLFAEKGLLQCSSDIHYLTVEEVFAFVQETAVTRNLKGLVEIRRAEYAAFAQRKLDERIETVGIPYVNIYNNNRSAMESCNQATGTGCSSGVAGGTARVVLDPQRNIENGNHILVASSTDPGWVFLMISAKGIIAEKGSVLSHTAIIGRELGIPTIVGVKDATRLIPDGAPITIDGSTGKIRWESKNSLLAQA